MQEYKFDEIILELVIGRVANKDKDKALAHE